MARNLSHLSNLLTFSPPPSLPLLSTYALVSSTFNLHDPYLELDTSITISSKITLGGPSPPLQSTLYLSEPLLLDHLSVNILTPRNFFLSRETLPEGLPH